MQRLQTDWVDLYYLHRMGSVPVEEVAEAMGRLVVEGLIRGWGLASGYRASSRNRSGKITGSGEAVSPLRFLRIRRSTAPFEKRLL